MNKQHVITLQGKDYVLFAGLLDEAHNQGLERIETSLIQAPTGENPLAVVAAQITTSKGTFHGLGDASPDSVNETLAPHLIRMAETRAVARALRFATNIAMTAFEELGRNGGANGTVNDLPEPAGSVKSRRVSGMTQEDYLRKLCQTRVVDTDLELEVQKLFDHKAKHGEIPVYEASRLIDKLKACAKKGKVA